MFEPSLAAVAIKCSATGLRRRILHSSVLGRIEDFSAPGNCPAPHGHSAEYQLVLPYAGAFEWHVAATTVLLDSTKVLFVGAGEDYADAHVAGCGHDSIILTPRLSLLQELCGHAVPSRHPAFQGVAKPAMPRMNMRTHRLRQLEGAIDDPLACDELMIALLGEALGPTQAVVRDSAARSRLGKGVPARARGPTRLARPNRTSRPGFRRLPHGRVHANGRHTTLSLPHAAAAQPRLSICHAAKTSRGWPLTWDSPATRISAPRSSRFSAFRHPPTGRDRARLQGLPNRQHVHTGERTGAWRVGQHL